MIAKAVVTTVAGRWLPLEHQPRLFLTVVILVAVAAGLAHWLDRPARHRMWLLPALILVVSAVFWIGGFWVTMRGTNVPLTWEIVQASFITPLSLAVGALCGLLLQRYWAGGELTPAL